MPKYHVRISLVQYGAANVIANTSEEAEEKARECYASGNVFGHSEEVSGITVEPEEVSGITVEPEEKEKYTCDLCGFAESWDDADDAHGSMWSCEVCGRIFCSKCFIDVNERQKYTDMVNSGEYIRCPDCFEKAEQDIRACIADEQLKGDC